MTRFISTRLDLSRIAAIKPALILDLDYEPILEARLVDLQARFDAIALQTGEDAIDVLTLETEPAVILQQADAYRQLLDYGVLNDHVRGLLPTFATGVDLEHIATRSGIVRQVLTYDEAGLPLTYEDDETFRMRYFASFGAPAAGSDDAYVFAALTAYPAAWHVYVLGPAEHGEPGQVDVVVTAPGGVEVDPADLLKIQLATNAKSVRPLTDILNIVPADVVPYTVNMTCDILRGPDPVVVRDAILANLQRVVNERYRGGGEVPRNALAAAAYDAGALAVTVLAPIADIPRQIYVAPYCSNITVTVVERLND